MKTRITLLVSLVLLVVLVVAGSGLQAAPQSDNIIAGSYIVKFDDSVTDLEGQAFGLAQAHGAQVKHVYGTAFRGAAFTNLPAARVQMLLNNPSVVSVVQDRMVSIQKGKPGGGDPPTGQEVPTGVQRINGTATGTTDVDVAVIDTGSGPHSDLNIAGGYNCQRGNSYDDGNGHGTHVAGTIGALDNSEGVIGVAPGARIWSVRVLDNSGSGSWSSVICGIDWVTANAGTIEVANMSLGGGGSEGSCNDGGMHEAICNAVNAGVTFVVAAGNDASNAANFTPANYNEVITVSALADFDGSAGGNGSPTCRTDEDDTFANFSNYGSDVDIIAPGVCINSTWKGGGYNSISGTSMASPHVAGAAALYLANNPGRTPDQVKSALQAAGNTNWDNSDDGDNTKEKLLDVSGW